MLLLLTTPRLDGIGDLRYYLIPQALAGVKDLKGIGVYDEKGQVKGGDVGQVTSVVDPRSLMWEALNKEGQEYFIKRLGISVNLGNIKPEDIIPLEGLRRGLRGDTF